MKRIKIFLSIMLLLVCFLLVGCEDEQKTFKVAFDTDGGSEVTTVEVKEGEKLAKPINPSKEGFTFAGWFENETCLDTDAFNFELAINKDYTLYAKWNEKLPDKVFYTIGFETGDGTEVKDVEVEANNKLEAPEEPVRDKCLFVGWYTDDKYENAFSFDTVINKDYTLYAKWEGNTFIGGIQLNNNLILFGSNKGEKENKRIEFYDLTKHYMVGDDNSWNVMPEVDFIKYNTETFAYDPTDAIDWEFDIVVSLLDGAVYTELDKDSEYIDSIDYVNCTIDFSDMAVGKQFKVVIVPKNLTEKQEANKGDYTVEFAFDVIDGYNIYNAIDFSLLDNRTNDDEEAVALRAFKEEKGISLDFKSQSLVLHNDLVFDVKDLPSKYFYSESELSKSDEDYSRTLGSMKDRYDFFVRELKESEEFNIYGNYFSLDISKLREVTREENKITPVGQVISHTSFLRFRGDITAKSSIQNLNIIGNAPKVENTVKAGGQIFIKVEGPSFDAYNNIAACWFITYMPNYTFTPFVIDKCKAYDSFNCFVYNWGADKVYIKNSEMIGAGGPVIIQDHVDSKAADGGKIGRTYVENSILESYVTGSEGWFSVVGASSVIPGIKGLDALFNYFGQSFLKSSTDGTLKYMNIISVNKSGSAQGLTAEKIKGTIKIDDYNAFDFGETNPYIAGMLEQTFTQGAPAFQTSASTLESGYCFTDGATGLFDLTNTKIVDPNNLIYSGEYLCLYYQGMSIVLGYGPIGQTYELK